MCKDSLHQFTKFSCKPSLRNLNFKFQNGCNFLSKYQFALSVKLNSEPNFYDHKSLKKEEEYSKKYLQKSLFLKKIEHLFN